MDSIEHILSICTSLYRMAENVKANKERCQRVAQRAKALEDLVLIIKARGPSQMSPTVVNALKDLCATLDDAKQLMTKYSQTKPVMSFLKSGSHEEKFNKINEKFTDNFQVLSGALQVEHGNILYKVYDTVSGRRQEDEYDNRQAATSPTAPMPLPSPMPLMPATSPTAPMPLPSPMPLMPATRPTAPMPLPSPMPLMPVTSPTAPMPLPYNMTPSSVYSPTAPMPLPSPMPLMPVTNPTPPVPFSGTMPPIQMSSPTTAMPAPSIVSSMPMSSPIAPMSLPGTMAPIRYTTTAVSNPIIRTVVPMQAPYNMASMALAGSAFPMNMPVQSVVRGYIIKKS